MGAKGCAMQAIQQDEERLLIEPLLPPPAKGRGRPRTTALRSVVDALFFIRDNPMHRDRILEAGRFRVGIVGLQPGRSWAAQGGVGRGRNSGACRPGDRASEAVDRGRLRWRGAVDHPGRPGRRLGRFHRKLIPALVDLDGDHGLLVAHQAAEEISQNF
jgi:hypothetical protein